MKTLGMIETQDHVDVVQALDPTINCADISILGVKEFVKPVSVHGNSLPSLETFTMVSKKDKKKWKNRLLYSEHTLS